MHRANVTYEIANRATIFVSAVKIDLDSLPVTKEAEDQEPGSDEESGEDSGFGGGAGAGTGTGAGKA